MSRRVAGAMIAFVIFAFSAWSCAAGEKKVEKVLKSVGFGYSAETYLFPRKPANRDLELKTRDYYIGSEDGTKFYYGRDDTEVSQSGPTRWFSIPVHSEEYGVELTSRFSTRPRMSLSLGFGRKEVESDSFVDKWYVPKPADPDIMWICTPDSLCTDTLWWAPVVSNPFVVGLSVKPGGGWRADLKMRREKIEIQTAGPFAKPSESVKLYSLEVSRKWGRLDTGLLVERLRADRAPSNRHIEAAGEYRFWKGARVFMKAGVYSSGLPLMNSPLSDLGGKFIFEYLGGNEKFTPLYTEKIGYYTLGIGYNHEFN